MLFFCSWEKKYHAHVYICPSGGGTYNHLTYILRKSKSVRSEPQDTVFAVEVQTPKLPCLTRIARHMFETNVVERVNSGQISLVVTCTANCTCHHDVTLHRNQWNKRERKRLNTNWKFCVSSDQWRTRLCRLLGLAKRVSGFMVWGPPTLSPVSLFDSGWYTHVDSHLPDSVVRAEISNNT